MNLSKLLNILVDMDVIVFRSSLVGQCDTDWGGGVISTELNIEKAKDYMNYTMKNIVSTIRKYKGNGAYYKGDYEVLCCLSDKVNFRKTLYPEYKANRTKPKPQLYADLRRYAEENYDCQWSPALEADDQIGILGTSLESVVIASIDKDFLTIPNVTFYNIDKKEFIETTEESARYAFYYQCLLGDSIDNIKGCVGIGKVKAAKILAEECSWETVVQTYKSKGQTVDDAVFNARLVRILHASDWDSEKQQVILWQPKSAQECSNECQKEVQ